MITRTVTAALASATLAALPAGAEEASGSGQEAAPERTEMQESYLDRWSDRMDDLSEIASEEADEAADTTGDAAAEAFDTLGDRWADLKDATEEEWAEAQAAFQRAYNDYLAAEAGDEDAMGSEDGSAAN